MQIKRNFYLQQLIDGKQKGLIKIVTGICSVTIDRYLDYMQDAFLVEKAIRYDIKGKKYIGNLSKYYFSGLGIRELMIHPHTQIDFWRNLLFPKGT